MASIPSSIFTELEAQARDDPLLPRRNPTTSFWQSPPHHTLSEIQSDTLPQTTDYAIIGSGVTGCSVAKNLLENSDDTSNLMVLEARTLTSGATGRNGGLLTTFVPLDYKIISENFGHEQAVKIARYANRTLDKMYELANSTEELKSVSEVRRLQEVICFEDEEAFRECVESLRLYEEHVPEERGKSKVLSAEEASSKYNMRVRSGAILFPNGAFWPYRLITHVWALLLSQYQSQLSIETYTPVTEISYDATTNPSHPYILHTPRGNIRASKVIHATNGWAGHLIPELRGKIYPIRGTMSTQKSTAEFDSHSDGVSWSMVGSGAFDSTSKTVNLGLYYANQNVKTRDIFIGGEKVKITELLISDDTSISATSEGNISTLLPKVFTKGWNQGEKPEVKAIWSGIMGFTADRMPLVGILPSSTTKRGVEGGEWIAAGFNGYGMPLCWSAGEAIAKMLLGMDVGDFLPEVFLVTEERLQDEHRIATGPALKMLFSGHV